MKKIFKLGVIFFLLFCRSVFAGEGPSPETRETIEPDQKKERFYEGIGFGPEKLWRISPGFKYKTVYDSNVNREPHDREDHDIIMNFIPNIALSRIGSRFGILADYEMNYQLYLRDSDQNGFNHRFRTRTWYESDRLKLKATDDFGHVKSYATSEQSERRRTVYNHFSPEAVYRLTDKVSVSAIYENYLFHYLDSVLKQFSYVQNDLGGRVYYHTTDKTDLFVQGSAILTDYYERGPFDSQGFGVYGGAIGRVTDRTTVNLKTGFEGREYDNESINSFYDWVAEAGLRHDLTSKTKVTLIAKRGIQESVYQNTAWYRFNRISLGFEYRVTEKITAELSGGFQNNRYPRETTEATLTKKRNDSILTSSAKLRWEPVQFLQLAIGYVFGERFSNFDEFDYIDHAVEASTALKF